MHHSTPTNLTEKLYRYFEPHLNLAVTNWPKETFFDLSIIPAEVRYAPTTFVARFRDAVISLKRFGWETYVDVAKLSAMSGEFIINIDPQTGFIHFRRKQPRGRPILASVGKVSVSTPTPVQHPSSAMSVVPWKDITGGELESLALLLANGRIQGPVLVEGDVRQRFGEDVTVYERNMDVAFTWDEKRGVTVVM